jgi:hypothetical protein
MFKNVQQSVAKIFCTSKRQNLKEKTTLQDVCSHNQALHVARGKTNWRSYSQNFMLFYLITVL